MISLIFKGNIAQKSLSINDKKKNGSFGTKEEGLGKLKPCRADWEQARETGKQQPDEHVRIGGGTVSKESIRQMRKTDTRDRKLWRGMIFYVLKECHKEEEEQNKWLKMWRVMTANNQKEDGTEKMKKWSNTLERPVRIMYSMYRMAKPKIIFGIFAFDSCCNYFHSLSDMQAQVQMSVHKNVKNVIKSQKYSKLNYWEAFRILLS